MSHRDHHHSERQNHTAQAARPGVPALGADEGPTQAGIRERAYALSQQRRGGPGSPEEDWSKAESQLRAERLPAMNNAQDR